MPIRICQKYSERIWFANWVMVEFHCKIWLFCICSAWTKKVSSHPGNTRAAMWFTQEGSSVRHPFHLRRRSFETFSCSFMDKHILFHLSAQFWALHHPQHNAIRSPMTIQHSPWVHDDSRLLWASCLQCCFGVCCFCAWVCVCVGINGCSASLKWPWHLSAAHTQN